MNDYENFANRHRFGQLDVPNPWGLRLAILACAAFWAGLIWWLA
jgi:hypothetical protein